MRDVEALALGAVPVAGFPGYYVTCRGDVYSARRVARSKPIRKLRPNSAGTYDGYGLWSPTAGKAITVRGHRIVAIAWIPNEDPTKTVVRHLDGNPRNNNASNLAWGTHAENIADKFVHGTIACGLRNGRNTKPESTPRGESHSAAKLTELDVMLIRERLASGELGTILAQEYGVRTSTISSIRTRRSWGHLNVG